MTLATHPVRPRPVLSVRRRSDDMLTEAVVAGYVQELSRDRRRRTPRTSPRLIRRSR